MAAVIGIFLAGCATAPSGSPAGSPAQSQDDLLSAAGFSLREAKTPQASAYLKTLPPQQIVQHQYKGTTRYLVCTDQNAKACYVGDEAALSAVSASGCPGRNCRQQAYRERAALGP